MKTLVRILTLFLYLFSIFACLVGCGNIDFGEDKIVECDHSFGEWIPHENNHLVQCQERLYQRSCTLCGKFDNKYGSMLDHEFGDAVTVPPTCDKGGYDRRECIYCGMEIQEKKTPPTGKHNIKTIVNNPNCGYEGYEFGKCTNCDYIEFRTIPPVGEHTFGYILKHSDKHYYMCSVCGCSYLEGAHTFDESDVCTDCGYRKGE